MVLKWLGLILYNILLWLQLTQLLGQVYYGLGGANDGVVPFTSQAWGSWKGEPSANWYATGIDHLQATNFEWTGQNFFNVTGWYLAIATNAKALQ